MKWHCHQRPNNLFKLDDKIIFYDLTNTYFEGRKLSSGKAKFGRSKEKRSDAKLISLALVVNAEGFIKQSKIYKGNIGESTTLEETMNELSSQDITEGASSKKRPTIVMDAGISTEENLLMLKEKGYDYICVTRSKLKNYKSIKKETEKITLYDKRNNPIEIEFVKELSLDKNHITIRKCSIPNFEVKEIFQAFKLKQIPFYKRKFVLPEK